MQSFIENLDLPKILEKALENGGDYADIFIEVSQPTSVTLEDNKIERFVSGKDMGAGVRVIFGEKTAYAYSNEISEKSLLELASVVNKAVNPVRGKTSNGVKGYKRNAVFNLRKKNPKTDFKIERYPLDIDTDKKAEIAIRANRVARAIDKRVRQVIATYGDRIQQVWIANSEGDLVEDLRVYTLATVHVVTADGDIIQTGYEPIGGLIGFEIFDSFPIENVAEIATKRALMMLEAKRAPGGLMPVVISSDAGGTMIHEAIGHGLEADLAQQGLSVYSNKIGETIASSMITVVDDATLPNKRGSFRFDDEGVESERTVLVKNGVLKNYMYDRLTAMKDGKRSTGNGRRESYHKRPIPRMTNTLIEPGEKEPSEILRSVDKGLFVKKMGGGQVNTVNGDFVFEVNECYLIENGKIGDPVRGATLTGNGPKILKMIDMIGNDLGFSIGTCGKDGQGVPVSDAMPTLRIPEIIVGGKV
ncbi:MAG: TldD/PmbA family protein [Nitrospirae bacterium]|nr:TldD/PmbA family protein [Nitrospirota bacterium]